jgi:triosephosphate isomerase
MARKPMIAGNWKMNKTAGEGVILVQNTEPKVISLVDDVEIVFCPPFIGLKSLSTLIELDKLEFGLGAQNCHWAEDGAYTGEISTRMLVDLRVDYVIIGHSERREMFGETDETVNKKVKAVFEAGMVPIMCIGESIEVREEGGAEEHCRSQVRAGLDGVSAEDAARLVIAYEPIWAIGTGRTPTPENANDVSRSIRATVGAMFGPDAATTVRILYGGSMKPENAAMFLAEPDIDGGLIGGAALDADAFADVVKAAQ